MCVEAAAEAVQGGISNENRLEEGLWEVDGIARTGSFIVSLKFVSLIPRRSSGRFV